MFLKDIYGIRVVIVKYDIYFSKFFVDRFYEIVFKILFGSS